MFLIVLAVISHTPFISDFWHYAAFPNMFRKKTYEAAATALLQSDPDLKS
jgi:hypothetical protein